MICLHGAFPIKMRMRRLWTGFSVLFFRYHNICEPDMINTLRSFRIDIKEISAKDAGGHAFAWSFSDKNEDEAFVDWFLRNVDAAAYDAVLSVNYWPLLSYVCQKRGTDTASCFILVLFTPSGRW